MGRRPTVRCPPDDARARSPDAPRNGARARSSDAPRNDRADTDADIDADIDANIDADIDADFDADIDADFDADIDADFDADFDADIDADIDGVWSWRMIVELAREIGFHRAAVVPIEAPRRHELYTSWLAAGRAGEMAYLARADHVEPRADLRRLLAEARSLIVVALAYDRADPVVPASRLRGRIARYARGEDYHLVMRDKLVALADRLAARLGATVASRPCVDSAPVLEREWAERGGLGFVAKNTMVIAPGLGSYIVLGELLVDVELPITAPDAPAKPRCGTCRACLDACPTNAFVDAYVLDARRCISYLTIEYHGAIPRELRPLIGTWVFGCDVCQEVCPFNAGAGEPPDALLVPRTREHALPDLVALANRNTNQLRQLVRRTALRRVPRSVLLRNVAVALGNTGEAGAIPVLVQMLAHREALVRGHAVWALARLGARDAIASHVDDDVFVRDELAAALAA